MFIGEGFCGGGANAAHINLFMGPKTGPIGTALATSAAQPGPGHIPFQTILKPNLPVKPVTLFIAKAVLRDSNHETMTWGPAQAGVAYGMTKALLDGIFPPEAAEDWVAIAAVWVSWNADDADAVYKNNQEAAFMAAQRALTQGWPSRAELEAGLASIGNPFYTPAQA